MTDIIELLKINTSLVESAIGKYIDALAENEKDFAILFDAMRYSLENGGKRIRPFLAIEFGKLVANKAEASELAGAVMPFATAIEFIHTYSLIHDDLPCMDDDEMRRGKPCNHKIFGEAGALLAGDALLTAAFGIIAENQKVGERYRIRMISELSTAAGPRGMVGGQQLDLIGEEKKLDFETLLKLHEKKTGELIRISCEAGCFAGFSVLKNNGVILTDDEEEKILLSARQYAHGIGLSFQIIDDILDCIATEEQLGKSVGGDAKHSKTTFLTFMDTDEAYKYAHMLTSESCKAISEYDAAETLMVLADHLLKRKN